MISIEIVPNDALSDVCSVTYIRFILMDLRRKSACCFNFQFTVILPRSYLYKMQIIVIKQETDELISIEVPHDANAELLVQMVQSEVGIPVQELRLEMEGVPIRGGSLIAQGVVDGTTIIARREAPSHYSHSTAATSSPTGHSHSHAHSQSANHPPPAPARHQQVQLIDPSSVAPERLLEFIRKNPTTLVEYKRRFPEYRTLLARVEYQILSDKYSITESYEWLGAITEWGIVKEALSDMMVSNMHVASFNVLWATHPARTQGRKFITSFRSLSVLLPGVFFYFFSTRSLSSIESF